MSGIDHVEFQTVASGKPNDLVRLDDLILPAMHDGGRAGTGGRFRCSISWHGDGRREQKQTGDRQGLAGSQGNVTTHAGADQYQTASRLLLGREFGQKLRDALLGIEHSPKVRGENSAVEIPGDTAQYLDLLSLRPALFAMEKADQKAPGVVQFSKISMKFI